MIRPLTFDRSTEETILLMNFLIITLTEISTMKESLKSCLALPVELQRRKWIEEIG